MLRITPWPPAAARYATGILVPGATVVALSFSVLPLSALPNATDLLPGAAALVPLAQDFGWLGLLAFVGLLMGDRFRLNRRLRRLEAAARCDGLTGLLHAGAFASRLEAEINRASRYDRRVSLLLLDLDDFKLLNDRYGHPAGDRALRFVASSLRGALRETDVIARIGGDEFAVLLPETDWQPAEQVAERLRGLLCAPVPGDEFEIGVSIGVATWSPSLTSHALYTAADSALYAEKRGRPARQPALAEPDLAEAA